ncbi:MAG: hypothetical protein B6226_06170 [Candidatus Cloacimonetes bacterium 4572_65]|nr:MAG: hypothetical protein B6226_06170 [Candidatus Cloacimonetes bacterium 4572_65]
MKKILIAIAIGSLLLTACGKKDDVKVKPTVEQKVVKYNFTVNGKGELSKEIIEKGAKNVKGVLDAKWNMQDQMIMVDADTLLDVKALHMAIAELGFDTKELRASDTAYKMLPAECKYRKLVKIGKKKTLEVKKSKITATKKKDNGTKTGKGGKKGSGSGTKKIKVKQN